MKSFAILPTSRAVRITFYRNKIDEFCKRSNTNIPFKNFRSNPKILFIANWIGESQQNWGRYSWRLPLCMSLYLLVLNHRENDSDLFGLGKFLKDTSITCAFRLVYAKNWPVNITTPAMVKGICNWMQVLLTRNLVCMLSLASIT